MGRWYRSQTMWIMPLVLAVVGLLEDLVTYKVRQRVHDVRVRAAIVLVLVGVGFGVAAGVVTPRLAKLLAKLRRESSQAGAGFTWLLYALCYGLVFYAYLVVERYGSGALLPPSLR